MRLLRSAALFIWRFVCRLFGRSTVTPKLPHHVVFNSHEYACLHEAGHVETALSVGARVVEVELYREASRSSGRVRADRTVEQGKQIALGGFAVEYLLYKADRLLNKDGVKPSEKEFINFAFNNAEDDRIAHFGGDYSGAGQNGRWPEQLDRAFMNAAIKRAEGMEFDLVERIAAALFAAKTKLDEDAIRNIVDAK